MKKIEPGNRVWKIIFDDGTKMKISIFDGRLTKSDDIYFINESSPLAKAIINKKNGDRIKYISDGKTQEVTIIGIVRYSHKQ